MLYIQDISKPADDFTYGGVTAGGVTAGGATAGGVTAGGVPALPREQASNSPRNVLFFSKLFVSIIFIKWILHLPCPRFVDIIQT